MGKETKNTKKSVHDIIIVELAIELEDLLLDRRVVNPSDMVLELLGYEEGWLSDYLGAYSDMALLDEGH